MFFILPLNISDKQSKNSLNNLSLFTVHKNDEVTRIVIWYPTITFNQIVLKRYTTDEQLGV